MVIPAAGSGTRLGQALPKAFVPLAGQTLLERSVLGSLASGVATDIVVAVPEALVSAAQDMLVSAVRAAGHDDTRVQVVAGGVDRVVSVQRALAAAAESRFALVHDAARCLAPPEVFARVSAGLLAGAAAVVPVLPMADTVKRVSAGTAAGGAGTGEREILVGDLDRTVLRRVQTPQGFSFDALWRAHELQQRDPDPTATDDAHLVERLGIAVEAVPGDERALKITHPIDLRIAQLYVDEETDVATGTAQ